MILSLAIFFILVTTAILTGSHVLRLFGCRFNDLEEELLFSYGLGLGMLAYLVLGVGIFGMLAKKPLLGSLALLNLAGLFRIPHLLNRTKQKNSSGEPRTVWLEIIFWLVALAIGLGCFVPLFDTDSLAYHLSTPREFLAMHRIGWIPSDVNSLFPFFTEMLFTLGLALKDETLALLLSWSLGVLLALAVAGFFRRFFGSRRWGIVAGLFILLTPGIFNEMRGALVDVAWSSYGFLSFYALAAGFSAQKKGWFVLSFIYLGVILGIKYLAAISIFSTLAVFLYLAHKSEWKTSRTILWLGILGIVTILAGGYWYLKAHQAYGNPFYPYFNRFFGLSGVMASSGFGVEEYGHRVGMGKSYFSAILLPFRLTFFPVRFDGWAEQIGPAWLVFLPYLFRGSWRKIRISLGIYAFVFTLSWFWLAQVSRFFYPALPFLALLVTSGMHLSNRQGKKNPVLIFFLAAVFLLNTAMLLFHTREAWAIFSGRETKEAFLLKRERSYPMAKFVNENLPRDAKILNAEEVRMFYFDRTLVRESGYRANAKYGQAHNGDEAIEYLKQDGFTHILTSQFGKKQTKGAQEWIRAAHRDRKVAELHHSKFQERNGREVDYSLYRI